MGLQGPQGNAGSTGPTGPAGADGSPETGTQIVTKINDAGTTGTVGANRITNRNRRVFVPSNAFTIESNAAPNLMQGSGSSNSGIWVRRMSNGTSDEAASVTIQVPSDYAGSAAAGLSAPRLTIYWASDNAGKINMDVAWRNLSDMIGANVGNSFRYNFRSSVTVANGDSFCESGASNPVRSVVAQVIPSVAENDIWSGTGASWAANDLIVLTLRRNGSAGDDPNSSVMYLVGVGFEYEADQ